jgi:hypothetical protein
MFPALQLTNSVFRAFHVPGQEFWAAGVQPLNGGAAIPTFNGDVVLRGGIARLTVGAYPENVILRVRVWAVWAEKKPDIDIYNGLNNTNIQVEWDPSCLPDFSTSFGRILYSKQAVVPVGEVFEIVHRFKPQKIDQAVFRGQAAPLEAAGNQLWWLLSITSLDVNGISSPVTCVNSWNLSFSSDASP